MRMTEKCRNNNKHNNNSSDTPLTSRCTDGGKSTPQEATSYLDVSNSSWWPLMWKFDFTDHTRNGFPCVIRIAAAYFGSIWPLTILLLFVSFSPADRPTDSAIFRTNNSIHKCTRFIIISASHNRTPPCCFFTANTTNRRWYTMPYSSNKQLQSSVTFFSSSFSTRSNVTENYDGRLHPND